MGCADDEETERFYLKNGYQAFELVAKRASYKELASLSITDYDSGKLMQKKLRDQYDPEEVIFIFGKKLE
ncbi:MAG: hypothetical protein AAF587_36770 [Bacteroidota bacterium]